MWRSLFGEAKYWTLFYELDRDCQNSISKYRKYTVKICLTFFNTVPYGPKRFKSHVAQARKLKLMLKQWMSKVQILFLTASRDRLYFIFATQEAIWRTFIGSLFKRLKLVVAPNVRKRRSLINFLINYFLLLARALHFIPGCLNEYNYDDYYYNSINHQPKNGISFAM